MGQSYLMLADLEVFPVWHAETGIVDDMRLSDIKELTKTPQDECVFVLYGDNAEEALGEAFCNYTLSFIAEGMFVLTSSYTSVLFEERIAVKPEAVSQVGSDYVYAYFDQPLSEITVLPVTLPNGNRLHVTLEDLILESK